MKNILLILAIAFSSASFAQGNLQFNQVIKVIDVDRNDELEGFTLTANKNKAIAVSSSRKDNVNFLEISW